MPVGREVEVNARAIGLMVTLKLAVALWPLESFAVTLKVVVP
jgi:hypothetical protein